MRQHIEMVSSDIPAIKEFLKRSKFNEFLCHSQIFQIVQGQKCILVNLSDVVFLQIPEKNIYYCKHNIFRGSIQMDTKDMSCFQTKLPKTKIFQFHWDKFSFVVSALLCWENSFECPSGRLIKNAAQNTHILCSQIHHKKF